MNANIIKYLRERHALGSVVYYIIAVPALIFFMTMPQFNDGGPCNPGTNLLVLLLAVLATVLLFCVYTIVLLIKGGAYHMPFFLHLSALIIVVLFIFIASMIG